MKVNSNKITGVLNVTSSAQHFDLRRYYPPKELQCLIEQFWFVDWDIPAGRSHTQENLPDPNFHLVIDQNRAKVIAPVSKKYVYTMTGKAGIIGVKFNAGALFHLLEIEPSEILNTEIFVDALFDFSASQLVNALSVCDNDEQRVNTLTQYLRPVAKEPPTSLIKVRKLLSLIKQGTDIYSVEELSTRAGMSIRSIQRLFKQYLGFSPKWLIRKYRLHHALELIETGELNVNDLIYLLNYSDQSHLINDFKSFTGTTPSQYMTKLNT
jgi:AraC-like DNA-binding protein